MSKRATQTAMVALLLIAFAKPFSAAAQGSRLWIVDVHTHLVPDSNLDFDAALRSAILTMDKFGIETSILMSPPRRAGTRQNYDAADFRAALGRYPGRFAFLAGGGTLNPVLHSQGNAAKIGEKKLEKFSAEARHLIDAGAVGFGEMGGLHISLATYHGYSFVPADHPMLLALADVAAERGVPIDLHMDALASEIPTPARLTKFPNNPKKFPATLPGLERLLSHNRQAKIVWAHGGTDHLGAFGPKTISRLMDNHPNLFVSLKVAGPKATTKNKLFSGKRLDPSWRSLLTRHPDRFVVGTDNFYAEPKSRGSGPLVEFSKMAVPRLQATIAFLDLLPPDLARKIGRDNAVQLYGLKTVKTAAQTTSRATAPAAQSNTGLCRDGNLEHCKILCDQGKRKACDRLRK